MSMTINPLVTAFRGALGQGKLLVQHCDSCGHHIMYPRHACPFCQSTALGWHEAGGGGNLMSFTVLRVGAPEGFEGDLPYAIGIVRLDEGVQMLCRLLPDAQGAWDHYACDMRVGFVPATAQEVERRPCAWFQPAAA